MKRSILFLILLAIMSIFVYGLVRSKMIVPPVAVDLNFSIDLGGKEFRQGEPISIRFDLKNLGGREIYIGKDIGIITPFIQFENNPSSITVVVTQNSKPYAGVADIRVIQATAVTPGEYTEIKPGESVIESFADLNYLYPLGPGTYSIYAVYQNQPDETIHKPLWDGEVRSNEIKFTIR